MGTYTLILQDSTRWEHVANVVSFLGEDASGKFGVLAGHEHLITSLNFGLARFLVQGRPWEYLALPGALVYFRDNQLTLSTRRYFRDTDHERISAALRDQLVEEERELGRIKRSLHTMEEEMLKRLWQLRRGQERQA